MVSKELLRKLRKRKRYKKKGIKPKEIKKRLEKEIETKKAEEIVDLIEKIENVNARLDKSLKKKEPEKTGKKEREERIKELLEKKKKLQHQISTQALQLGEKTRDKLSNYILKQSEKAITEPESEEKKKRG